MTIQRIPVADLEAYCAAYGQGLAEAIRIRFPPSDGAHQVPMDQWYSMARAARIKLQPRYIGLGDIVAAIATPIAKAVDAAAHTNIQNCGGCKKRREMLNRIHL